MRRVMWLPVLAVLLHLCLAGSVAAQARVERNVVIGMYSGLALLMDVHYPDDPNGYGIVFISGSGWTRDLGPDAVPLKETGQMPMYGGPLVDAGYTVFSLNHRAAPRFRHPAHLADVQRAVRFVRHHAGEYGIDPARIGAMGGSSGGHLVSLLGVLDGKGDPTDPSAVNRESAKVQVVVARAAPSDITLFERPIALHEFQLPAREGSLEYRQAVEASPVTYVTPDDPPFLLIHGDLDETVPFEHSEVMKAALEDSGVEVELIRIPGAGHGPRFPGAQNPPDYIGAMVEWFNRYLPK